MRRILRAVILAAMLAPAVVAAQAATARQQIQRLLDDQVIAANAHDTDRFLVPYVHDSTLLFVFNGSMINGFAPLRAQQLKWWNNGKSDVAYRMAAAPTFMILSPTIVAVTEQLASSRTGADGRAAGNQFVVTMLWQRRADGWKIIQSHESTVH